MQLLPVKGAARSVPLLSLRLLRLRAVGEEREVAENADEQAAARHREHAHARCGLLRATAEIHVEVRDTSASCSQGVHGRNHVAVMLVLTANSSKFIMRKSRVPSFRMDGSPINGFMGFVGGSVF